MVVSPMTRPGQHAGTGDDNAIFWRLFAGEILTYFHRKNLMMPLHRVKTIANGKSTTFPVTGTASASRHVAGESIYGTDNSQSSTYLSNIGVKEREIFVDDPMISGFFTPTIDRLKNHWDERSVFAQEVATVLANTADRDILSTIYAAAKADPATATQGQGSYSPMPVASKDIDITDASVGANIANGIFTAQELFDTYNIPREGRVCVLRPKQYHALASVQDLVNKDWTSGAGDTTKREIMSVGSFRILMTNAFKTTDDSAVADAGANNDPHGAGGIGYNCDWRNLAGLCFVPDAAATVKMKELGMESEYSLERRGYTVVADYVMGHNILRPECAVHFTAGAGPVGTGIA